MKSRVHYGEYSLSYWLHLLISGDVQLPRYQRNFVWSQESVEKLIGSLKEGQYVPPVTVGAFVQNGRAVNYIIDGQQRLTTVLLGALGLFPLVKKFELSRSPVIMPYTSVADEEDDDQGFDFRREWTMNKLLLHRWNALDALKASCSPELYKPLKMTLSEDDLKTVYLGFSYIVLENEDENLQQKFYARCFRDLNISGSALNPMESRRALYFCNAKTESLFEPEFTHDVVYVGVSKKISSANLDFVRCLSFMAQFAEISSLGRNLERVSEVACGGSKKLEAYFEEFIYAVVGGEADSRFGCFSKLVPDDQLPSRMKALADVVDALGYKGEYKSIIDSDLRFFGLTYWVLLMGRTLDLKVKDELNDILTNKMLEYRRDDKHMRTPGAVLYLRRRILDSYQLYKDFFDEK